ncbi:MAG: hypothetical protein N3E36_04445 [Sulfolobales archaeon]|nr:hypothetical protein [Sulfolobales archaeon]MCX8199264.1 hypothetical protein [Sulfolobales archaeon]MDW8170422.1 hypothetical protein [Desulfurococcaceae archaeon]
MRNALSFLCIYLLLIALIALPANASIDGESFFTTALQNPKVLITMLIQFTLGFGLGYFGVKVIKYVLAFIAILVIGAILSIWSLGEPIDAFLSKIVPESKQLLEAIYDFLKFLGVMTVGPIAIGFMLGALVAIVRK